jgi:pentatricopeptide repeat domain-containing protein 1
MLLVQVAQEVLPVVAAAILLIAVQQTSGGTDEAAKLSAGPISESFGMEMQSVLNMALQLRQVLHNDTVAISAMRCLKVYMERMGCG